MKNLFFPAVVPAAVTLQTAPVLVLANEIARLPLFAHLKRVVLEQMRLPSEVLPVMRIDTLRLIVFGVVGTPLSLEVKHIEFLVARHLVNQGRLNVLV